MSGRLSSATGEFVFCGLGRLVSGGITTNPYLLDVSVGAGNLKRHFVAKHFNDGHRQLLINQNAFFDSTSDDLHGAV